MVDRKEVTKTAGRWWQGAGASLLLFALALPAPAALAKDKSPDSAAKGNPPASKDAAPPRATPRKATTKPSPADGADKETPPSPALLAVDVLSGTVLYSDDAGQPRHPASLTKMMTLYVAFQAIKDKRASAATPITVSPRAAAQGGSLLGLRRGETITLGEAMRSLVVRSANDAAVAIAEHLAGSESAFADRMTREARRLGMNASRFHNATGLTAAGHLVTARDMAILALALRRDFPDLYPLFSSRNMTWKKHTLPTVNGFMASYPGAEGLKTGFTCPAGYNLVAAARRGGKHVVAVVMGATSRADREARITSLMNRALGRGWDGKGRGGVVQFANLSGFVPDLSPWACKGGVPGLFAGRGTVAVRRGPPSGWALEIIMALDAGEARDAVVAVQGRLSGQLGKKGTPYLVIKPFDGAAQQRGLLAGLSEEAAMDACRTLRGNGEHCLVLSPEMVEGAASEEERFQMMVAQ